MDRLVGEAFEYNQPVSKIRIDLLLVEKGLVDTRSMAQRLVMAGQVRVNGELEIKPAAKVDADAQLVVQRGSPFVSRGGEKLEAAIQAFSIDPSGQTCADVGASTGGFTDCLLQHGANRVYAIDVGYGILHWKLRNEPRVILMERTNARFLINLPEPVTLVTMDVSFISIKLLLQVIRGWYPATGGKLAALIKPQFEAGKAEVDRGSGVIQDAEVHRAVLEDVLGFAQDEQFEVLGLIRSPLKGAKGNIEFLAHLQYPGMRSRMLESWIDSMVSSPSKPS